jgi:hypothetical protein
MGRGGVFIEDGESIIMAGNRNKLVAAFLSMVLVGAVFLGVASNVCALQFFFDDMDPEDPGWTTTGMWHLNTNRSYSPIQSWAYNNGVNYDDGGTNSGELTSPVIDLMTASMANLTFWTWYETEGGTSWDQMWIQISENAGPFINEYQIDPTDMNMWLPISLNLTSHVGNNIQLRFFFDTIDGSMNDYEGWYIDNVEVNDIPLPPTPSFSPPHEDSGLDTDANILYNYLLVNVTVFIPIAGDYIIYGELYDPLAGYITDDTNITFLNAGTQVVQLQFEGWLININGEDGIYSVELELSDDSWNLQDTDTHSTNFYFFNEFELPSASLEPPHSDYGEDTDSDTLFNYLVVNVTVNITGAGFYNIEGDLFDPFSSWLDSTINNTFLNVGIQIVQLRFDGSLIYNNGESGIFDVDFELYDDSWNWLDWDSHSTGFYDHLDFQRPAGWFEPPYSDYGEDTEPDTYFNFLVINVTVNITVAGTYHIQGDIFDPFFSWLEFTSNTTFLNIGIHVVQLRFDGILIYGNGESGVFNVDIYLYDDLWNWLDGDSHSTGFYDYFEFQPPLGWFEAPHSDYGEDTDSDTYFNYLVINVTVNITVGGTYEVTADLWDPFWNWLEFTSNTTFLNVGVQVVQLRFDGEQIYNNGESGFFNFQMDLYDDLSNWLDFDSGITGFYDYFGFEPPMAWLEPPHSDFGEDTDSDFLFNFLVIEVTVNVTQAGTYEVTGDLWDPFFSFLESDSNKTFLNAGLNVVQLRFDGVGIYLNGESGTYSVDIELYDDLANFLDSDTHTTAFYNYDEFQAPMGGIEPPHSDYGVDTDINTFFDYLVINVTVNITVAGDYEISGPLFDSLMNLVGYTSNNTFLSVGIHVVQLWYDGSGIYNNGINGTFIAMIELDDDMSNNIDSDTYVTNSYNYDDFDLPSASFLPPHSDYGLDTDIDTYFNWLIMEVTVDVTVAGNYYVFGRLSDPFSNFLEDDMNITFLSVGTHIVQLRFFGMDIYNGSENGNYEVELYLLDDSMNFIDTDFHLTSFYNYDEFQAPMVDPWATVNGPLLPLTNDPSPTITYDYGNAPTNVQIYWSDDGGSTWNNWGTDNSVDGSWPAAVPLAASGTYHWSARAMGGPSEPIPSGPGDIEDGPYVLDIDAPQVKSTTPPNLDMDVLLGQDIVIVFTEDMDPVSVDGTVEPMLTGISPAWSVGNTTLTLTHDDFAPNTRYWVNITVGTDLAGNNIDPLPDGFYFDTEALPNTATATGPMGGPFNVAGIDILYGTTNSPPTVDLYYTTDISSPYTWALIGTDNPADGTYPWTIPSDGSYGWYAVSPDESAPLNTDAPEASFYVFDGTAPNVQSTVPLDMAVDVLVTENVEITFDEPMIPGSVTYSIEPDPGGLSQGWSGGDTIIMISHNDFTLGTRYWVNITAGTDPAGNDLVPLPYSFYFDSVFGNTATAIGPISSPTNIGGITITYISTGSPPTVDIYYTTDTSSPYTWNLIGTDNPADGNYPWVVPADGSYSWIAVSPDESAPLGTDAPEASFYVYDGTQPDVSGTDPLDLAVGIAINQRVGITFDEPMMTASVTYTIEPDPGGLSEAWTAGDTVITISHTNFLTSTKYWVNITAGIDLAGNDINTLPYSFSFDTAATGAFATGPTGGPTNVAGITITYGTAGGPLTTDIYYTTETSAPFTWNFLVTDNPADGSFGWTIPADGSYGWFVVSPDESAPTPTDAPEAFSYIYDGTRPQVTVTSPLNMATSVLLSQVVNITFDEPMIPGSIAYTIEPSPGGLAEVWGMGNQQVNILHTDFAGGVRYWVNITAITDEAGNDLDPLPYSFYFDTATFATATGPIGGPSNIAGILLTYSMIGTPSDVDLYYTTDISSPYTWTLLGNDNPADGVFGWTVPADGSYGWYAVSPDETAPIATDAPEASIYIYDGTQPEVLDTFPLDQATGVLIDQFILITFNETMIPGSVTYTIEPILGGLLDSWSIGNTQLNITHANLTGGIRYWINITAGTDLAGNNINPLPYSFYFDTQIPDTIPPTVNTMKLSKTPPISTGTLKFTLTFSEDMNTLVDPTVTFGQASPFNTYTIVGSWTSNTTWVGSYAVGTGTGDGDFRVRVTGAEDLAGNPQTSYNSNQFEIDTTEPTSSVGTLSSFQITQTFNIPYTKSDGSGPGVDYVELYYRNDGGSWKRYGSTHTSSPISFNAPGEGHYEFYTIATDNAGNEEDAKTIPEASTTVDITKPDVISIVVSNPSPINEGTVTVTITFSEDMDLSSGPLVAFGLTTPFNANGIIQSTFSGALWTGTFTVTPATGDGTQTISITLGTDLAGNTMDEDTTFSFVIDTVSPDVSSSGPTGSEILLDSKIIFSFSESMNKTSVHNAFSLTDGTTTWTIANGSVSWSGNTLTFTPHDELDYDKEYTITMETTAKDLADNPISSEHSWTFATLPEPDTTAPSISTVSHTGEDAEITNKITITFNERMNQSEVEDAISITPGITIQSFYWLGNTLTITLAEDLEADTEYTVTIGTQAEDESGNSLEEPYTWSFTPKEEKVEPSSNMTPFLILIIVIVVVVVLLLLFMKKKGPSSVTKGGEEYPEQEPYYDEEISGYEDGPMDEPYQEESPEDASMD